MKTIFPLLLLAWLSFVASGCQSAPPKHRAVRAIAVCPNPNCQNQVPVDPHKLLSGGTHLEGSKSIEELSASVTCRKCHCKFTAYLERPQRKPVMVVILPEEPGK